jgi:hypothetical protein
MQYGGLFRDVAHLRSDVHKTNNLARSAGFMATTGLKWETTCLSLFLSLPLSALCNVGNPEAAWFILYSCLLRPLNALVLVASFRARNIFGQFTWCFDKAGVIVL